MSEVLYIFILGLCQEFVQSRGRMNQVSHVATYLPHIGDS